MTRATFGSDQEQSITIPDHAGAHAHSHSHGGHSHGVVKLENVNALFIWGIALNVGFVALEAVVGFLTHSLSLLSDAGHNLADVGSLALSLLAFRLTRIKANEHYTFGYRKSSVLAALVNSVILLISLGAIIYEAVQRLQTPQPLPGLSIAIVAFAGIAVNGFSAWLFNKGRKNDINVKSAYLHLLADAAISAGVAAAGLVIYYTGWFWLDAVTSMAIAVVILITTWKLLTASLRLSLDGVPDGITLSEVRAAGLRVAGVIDFHHIHVWAISSTENALTGHLALDGSIAATEAQGIKAQVKHALIHQNITHVTLETESSATECSEKECDTTT